MQKLSYRDPVGSGLLVAIRAGEPFDTHGALRARAGNGGLYGYLPLDWANVLARQAVDYVVYSYDTPIAWHVVETGWVMPDVRYSHTTGKHQSRVRWALKDEKVTTTIGLFM